MTQTRGHSSQVACGATGRLTKDLFNVKTRLSFVTSLGAVVAVLGGLTPACGSDSNTPRGKILEGGISGGGGGGNATGGSPGNAGGSSGSTGSSSLIGQPCLKDTDCGTDGLTCLADSSEDYLSGGVSHGICTLDCSADILAAVSDVGTCSKVDATAICVGTTPAKAYCLESCTVGPPSAAENKCHNRKDMACSDPRDRGIGYCKPVCRGDFDCGKRFCDLSSGVCVDKIDSSRKLPIGSKCDPNSDVDPCHGACVGILEGDASTTQVGFCSGYCKLGEQNGCGFDPSSTSVDAFCLFGTSQLSDFADLGFCAQVCDCNDDCLNPDFVCSTVTGLSDIISRPGACGPPSKTQPKGIACKGTRPKRDSGSPTVPPPDASPEAGPVVVPDAGPPPPVDAGTNG